MDNKRSENPVLREPSLFRNAKSKVVFAVVWFGSAFLILAFWKSAAHHGSAIYFITVPWVLIGLLVLVRPVWIMRAMLAQEKTIEKDLERAEKWIPPGIP